MPEAGCIGPRLGGAGCGRKRHNNKSGSSTARPAMRSMAAAGAKQTRHVGSGVLSLEDEAIIVAFRRHTLLPLDDCLHALQPAIPHLTRSSLHRCFRRHGISRRPDVGGGQPVRKTFKADPIGAFHVHIAEMPTAKGELHLCVAFDRITKFAFVELHEKATTTLSRQFLQRLIEAVPHRAHTVLTDNGAAFRTRAFKDACAGANIDHRTTQPGHPWTIDQVERMNRTIKGASKCLRYDDHERLKRRLSEFIAAYNFDCRLRTLRGLTPYAFVCRQWTIEPRRFKRGPPRHRFPPSPKSSRKRST